jgi:hypothetical protein
VYSVVARNNDILKKLVLEAKREYEKDAEHRVHIFMADTCVLGCSFLVPIVLIPLLQHILLLALERRSSEEAYEFYRPGALREGNDSHGLQGLPSFRGLVRHHFVL